MAATALDRLPQLWVGAPGNDIGALLVAARQANTKEKVLMLEQLTSTIRTPLYIDGDTKWTARTTTILDPARPSRVVGEAAAADPSDVAHAVESARRAFLAWRSLAPQQRADLLLAAVGRSDEEWQEDARILSQENGKILSESLRDTSMLARRTALVVRLASEVDAKRTIEADESFATD